MEAFVKQEGLGFYQGPVPTGLRSHVAPTTCQWLAGGGELLPHPLWGLLRSQALQFVTISEPKKGYVCDTSQALAALRIATSYGKPNTEQRCGHKHLVWGCGIVIYFMV